MKTEKTRRFAAIVAATAAVALAVAGCGKSAASQSQPPGSGGQGGSLEATLNGSGSTFQMPFDQAAIAGFNQQAPKVTVNYGGGGSGKGKTELANQVVDFAGTDSLVKDGDKAGFKGGEILYFPTVAAPITVSYNLDVPKLRLSAATLAKIFQAKITNWNDPAIAADNPGTKLPDEPIVVAHRADASGTTSNFSKYLDTAAKGEWVLGSGDTVNWPAGTQAGQGNAGVAQIVKSTKGAVGYVDYSDAKNAGLKFASVKNKAGQFVAPTLDASSKAVGAAQVAPDLTYSPLDTPGAGVYPITSPTWILVYAKQPAKAKGEALKAFLRYTLTDGQELAEPSSYAPLPAELRSRAVAQLDRIEVG